MLRLDKVSKHFSKYFPKKPGGLRDKFVLKTIFGVERYNQRVSEYYPQLVEDAEIGFRVGNIPHPKRELTPKEYLNWLRWARGQYQSLNIAQLENDVPRLKELSLVQRILIVGFAKEQLDKIWGGFKPYDSYAVFGNTALNEGLNRLLNLLTGQGGTAYNNANARIGTGTDATAPAASQTGLLANAVYKAMDTNFPSTPASQQVEFQGTYADADAVQAWNEESIDNGSTPDENLVRANTSLGTKPNDETWILKGTLTAS